MKWEIISVTTALIAIILVVLLFQIKIPMCYSGEEKLSKESYILYDTEVVAQVKENIKLLSLHYVKIIGNSMAPSIKNGDTCICTPQNTYQKGDIISFYIPSENNKVELISHRIVDEENNQFKTRGDNNNIGDEWVLEKEQIFCKVPEKSLFDKFKFAIVKSEGRFSIFSIIG